MDTDPNEKTRPWLLPAERKNEIKPGLYLAATPIGNLGDITLRALDVLSGVDFIICEDTRVTAKLLNYYGIKKKLIPYNDHNADRQRGPIVRDLAGGAKAALVSDAGTPLVSDPGFKLVRECMEGHIAVTALPGANAVLTALQLSGLPSDKFTFTGFLPPKKAARKSYLSKMKAVPVTLIAFETAPRLLDALEDILSEMGDRDIAVARELTKMFEETRRGKVSEVLEYYKSKGEPKGEIVLVIGAAGAVEISDEDAEKLLRKLLKTMGTKEAAARAAQETGRGKTEMYDLALKISK
ncbi:MAG: 16S rRNA (cytidine(1402)-2'-O)-methyltransferase [Alphaproteobacteria bacterium]|nr:16S rRNA (cytidine(1402)-2'-O)-methyltransferase [Alphaproteobacteria bacterium]